MGWAVRDPNQHAALLYSVYEDLFENRQTQMFPSMRNEIDHKQVNALHPGTPCCTQSHLAAGG